MCSSRTFPYDYLVTTSSQSPNLQSHPFSYRRTSKNIVLVHFYEKFNNFTSTSSKPDFRHVTGGVCKSQVQIHRNVLICDYLWFPLHVGELQPTIRMWQLFKISSRFLYCRTLYSNHCSMCVAQFIKAIKAWHRSHLPPTFIGSLL